MAGNTASCDPLIPAESAPESTASPSGGCSSPGGVGLGGVIGLLAALLARQAEARMKNYTTPRLVRLGRLRDRTRWSF